MTASIVLSPHPDDAVLSLWHILAGPGEVGVINVFTGDPAATELGWWDALSDARDPQTRAAERRAEDREALALASCRPADLDFIDDQYRPGDQPLEPIVAAIAAAAPAGSLLLAPAALGDDHPDHLLVRAAALALRERGASVALYADLPHATRYGLPRWVTDSASPDDKDDWRLSLNGAGIAGDELHPEVHRLEPGEEARKREAVGLYRTQFHALDRMFSLASRPELLRYEVVWRLPDAS